MRLTRGKKTLKHCPQPKYTRQTPLTNVIRRRKLFKKEWEILQLGQPSDIFLTFWDAETFGRHLAAVFARLHSSEENISFIQVKNSHSLSI